MTDPTMQRDHLLLQESLSLIAPVADDFVAAFYDRLFAAHPELRGMFPADMTLQRERLLKAVIALVTHFDHPEQLRPALIAMGRTHVRLGVGLAHYAIVGATLLETLREFAGPAWNPAYAHAWERAYTFAAGTMMASTAVDSMSDSRNGIRQAA
jgi:methyl-accepting chemotaxis protein